MARLNPGAPEFYPNQHHNQQLSISSHGVPTSNIPPQHCYFVLSSFYSSQVIHQLQLIQPHPPCLSSLSLPFHDGTNMFKQLNNTPLLPSGAEPTRSCYLAGIEPDTLMETEVEKQQKEVTEEAGSKGHAQNRVMNAIMGCGRMNGGRGVWRKKEKHVGENQKYGYFKNRRIFRRADKYFSFRAFSHKKRYGPVMPVRVDGEETTVMIKNIPNKYTRDMLVDFLDKQCVLLNHRDEDGSDQLENEDDRCVLAFDFVYLPIDFGSGMNKGYAFVNFTSPEGAWKFNLTASNMKWELFQSHKIREVVAARLQGIDNLRSHFESMSFPCESEEVLPVCYSPPRDGVIKGEQTTMGNLFKRHQV